MKKTASILNNACSIHVAFYIFITYFYPITGYADFLPVDPLFPISSEAQEILQEAKNNSIKTFLLQKSDQENSNLPNTIIIIEAKEGINLSMNTSLPVNYVK